MSSSDGHQALLSCLSKLTCFNKEDGVDIRPSTTAPSSLPSSSSAATAKSSSLTRDVSRHAKLSDLPRVANTTGQASVGRADDMMSAGDDVRRMAGGSGGAKLQQTKQWLQDLSTVAQYDVTTCASGSGVMSRRIVKTPAVIERTGKPNLVYHYHHYHHFHFSLKSICMQVCKSPNRHVCACTG